LDIETLLKKTYHKERFYVVCCACGEWLKIPKYASVIDMWSIPEAYRLYHEKETQHNRNYIILMDRRWIMIAPEESYFQWGTRIIKCDEGKEVDRVLFKRIRDSRTSAWEQVMVD
jgi:hypothetical protein